MRRASLILAASVSLVAALVTSACAKDVLPARVSRTAPPTTHAATPGAFRATRLETLWIFDADFEDLVGDNAGWTTYDRSGTLASVNYWHKDTIRIPDSLVYLLGDSTWWCGTYNECWIQPRGYGNEWTCILERSFPEVEANTDPGDELYLDWDQRFAMESGYDYGYVEISGDGGSTWQTHGVVSNPGFAGSPGFPQDWDSEYGHVSLNLSAYGGQTIDLRFRFVSDGVVSSEDELDNPPFHSVLDGAWQIDNTTWSGGTPVVDFWIDDCESGNQGWVREDSPASGQTGVTWWRGQYGIDFITGHDFSCDDRPVGSWMYAAVDPFTSTMVDDEHSWLMSPPIDISAAPKLVGQYELWLDMPGPSGDHFEYHLSSDDSYDCVTVPEGFVPILVGYGGPGWGVWKEDWGTFAGNDWLAIRWVLRNLYEPAEPHMAGVFLNRQRVGIPSGDAGTIFEHKDWAAFHDWFQDELPDALLDTARVKVVDDDGIASTFVVASNDGGQTWEAYACIRQNPGDPANHCWLAPPPANQMTPGSEVLYYYEATDGVGNTSTHPEGAPDEAFEMSILPITASTTNPGLLLVDKHGRVTPGEERNLRHSSEDYYREALEILGYDYEVYDVQSPSNLVSAVSHGPDTTGMKYYDTQIWFTNGFNAATLWPRDQRCLIEWLNQSAEGKERNLLLTGNNIGYELMESEGETLAFYETWLATSYLADAVGSVLVDTVPGLQGHEGNWDFMTHDDGEAILRGGCPVLHYFDVIEPFAGIIGTEIVADYVLQDDSRRSAGVAYTHATLGYQTVNLGFGIEFMMDGTTHGGSGNYTSEGYYRTGLIDRMNLLQNILDYFGKAPGGAPTGLPEGGPMNALSQAYPNPFNPVTKIAYSVKDAGPVRIEVYNVAGKVVRTLLDAELEAGARGEVVWDGRTESGEMGASGVYFYRITSPGFVSSRKLVMLK